MSFGSDQFFFLTKYYGLIEFPGKIQGPQARWVRYDYSFQAWSCEYELAYSSTLLNFKE